jgi:hypothetical protein
MTAGEKEGKPHGVFVPESFKTRIEALTSLIRFGPALLPNGEFLVLLFHAERSVTYGKKSDAASLSQITDGIRRIGGDWIRGGAGVTKSTAMAANTRLEERGLLKRTQKDSMRRGHGATEYEIRWLNLAKLLEKCGSGNTLDRLPVKPLDDKRSRARTITGQALTDNRSHRGDYTEGFHHQRGKKQRPETFVEGSIGGATPKETPKAKTDSLKSDDEKPKTAREGEIYAHPEDELKAIYREKTGDEISPDVERRVWELVEIRGVPRKQFMDELRKHVPNAWKNPAGFLTNFARKIGSVATPEPAPPAEPEPPKNGNGRCSGCNGIGYAHWDADLAARVYCDCRMGRELKRVDARPPAAETSVPALAAATEALAR